VYGDRKLDCGGLDCKGGMEVKSQSENMMPGQCCLNPSVLAKGHNSRPDCMSWKNVSLCSYKLNVLETRKVSLCSVN